MPRRRPPPLHAHDDTYAGVQTRDPWLDHMGRHFRTPWVRFMPTACFEGRRSGYCFKNGGDGLGYYLDLAQAFYPQPGQLTVHKELFRQGFVPNLDWDELVAAGKILNAEEIDLQIQWNKQGKASNSNRNEQKWSCC